MNHVWTVALRPAGLCLRRPAWQAERSTLLQAVSWLRNNTCVQRQRSPWLSTISPPSGRLSLRLFSSATNFNYRASPVYQKLKKLKPGEIEQGLAFAEGDLPRSQLQHIFGKPYPPPHFANRLLRVLHGRRVDGTLDIDPPEDIARELENYPYAGADALEWLRKHFPVDEDDAIMRRIEREESEVEQDSPAQLMQKAERLGLYKPQSGSFQAALGEEGDIFGKSQLEQIRAENVAKLEKEEEELAEHIQALTKEAEEKLGALVVQQDDRAVELASRPIRPPNEFEKWAMKARLRATSKLTLESPEIASLTTFKRLWPSFLLVATTSALCYLLAQYWTPPSRSERLWPGLSLSFATAGGIAACNILVYVLWHIPSAWRVLNRYFINVAVKPVALAALGSTFSHQTAKHLAGNMLLLGTVGLALHEDVGRGTFLAIYVASGAIGSWAFLAFSVSRGNLLLTSLGASGALNGVLAAFSTIHFNDWLTIFLVPQEWQQWFHFKGWVFLAGWTLIQALGAFYRPGSVDFVAHFAGLAVGSVCGWWWRENKECVGGEDKDRELWFEKILGKKPAISSS